MAAPLIALGAGIECKRINRVLDHHWFKHARGQVWISEAGWRVRLGKE